MSDPEQPLAGCVEQAVARWFESLDGAEGTDLYGLVMNEVEAPLLQAVLAHTDHNLSRAAAILGISRGTLRKKLRHHDL